MLIRRSFPVVLASLTLAACGADTETGPTDAVPPKESVDEAGGPGADAGFAPGDTVETVFETPDGPRTGTLEVAPPKDQGECPPGMVQAGKECIPNQPSG